MGEECRHGLEAAWCSVCLHGVTKVEDRERAGATFAAAYDAECGECPSPIRIGDIICRIEPTGRYVHHHCAP